MAYLYCHSINNIPFYIGIGSDLEYKRAYDKVRRGKFWKDFVGGKSFNVIILKDNISWEEACIEEIEHIKLYGKRIDKNGSLVNITDGGEGASGYRHSKERIEKIKKNSAGSSNPRAKECIHFRTGGTFRSLKEGCDYYFIDYKKEANAVKNKLSTANFYFKGEYFNTTKAKIRDKLGKLRIGNKNSKKYIVIDEVTGKEYESLADACETISLKYNTEYNRIRKGKSRFKLAKHHEKEKEEEK